MIRKSLAIPPVVVDVFGGDGKSLEELEKLYDDDETEAEVESFSLAKENARINSKSNLTK